MGTANVIGSFLGTFPVAGGLARTAVNVEAGARSQVSPQGHRPANPRCRAD
jgi:MFS superfamily sulfate permease-like transporter